MALDLSKLNFFSRLSARARVLVLFGAVGAAIFAIYLTTRYFSSDTSGIGTSSVANAPRGLQSVPGGQLTPEYYKALSQANTLAAEQAKMSGGSAVPTLINAGQPSGISQTGNCNIICSDKAENVKYDLDEWAKQGKISPGVSSDLQALADKNGSVEDYAAELNRLFKEGKLTPEQARELLEKYKKQHAAKLLQDSAKMMDDLIKSGQLPLDVANELLTAQKNGIPTSGYAAKLQDLVRQGKISPAVAQMLLAQYAQQRAKEIVAKSVGSLKQLGRDGMLTPEVEKQLIDLENQMVPIDTYSAALQRFVSSGKLIPATANKILEEFKSQKTEIGPTGTVTQMLQQAEAAAYGEINDLLKANKISQETAAKLTEMLRQNVSLEEQQATVNQMVKEGKLTPEIGKMKISDFQTVKGLREMEAKLNALQANNVSPALYADELKKAVQSGLITPDQAAQLMQEYQAMNASAGPVASTVSGPGSEDFAKLQQRLAQGEANVSTVAVPSAQFTEAQLKAQREAEQMHQAQLETMSTSMSSQAQQLIAAWQPVPMEHKEGVQEVKKTIPGTGTGVGTGAGAAAATATTQAGATTAQAGVPALIKGGTIVFAVLDTAVNSDYPDSPVMATVVDGKYKGAKLLGKLTTTKGVSGQMDRVMLNFTLMNTDDWIKSKAITAYAIDPDTARSVLASTVDYHYMQKYGAIMATSFLQGYASAVTNAGTSTTGIFGTSTSHPALSPSQKMAVALGQIGQSLGSVTQNYTNLPPTVKVDSGVGLGILFMSDVT